MKMHKLVQGSPEWLAFRMEYFGASEAAAMLGISPNVKRNELLHMKKTATPKEFSDFVRERILENGHKVEAMARPLIEDDLGEDLYPVTCSDGKISASCDGLTMGGDIAFEHKQWNEVLAQSLRNGILPDEHQPQVQQIAMVTGCERIRFVCSDGTRERMVWLDVFPDGEWAHKIRAGWSQFERDLAEYEIQPAEIKPVGRTPESLPALLVEVTGHVTASNLREYRDHAIAVFQSINRNLETDQDFADAEKTVKWAAGIEEKIEAAKQHALSQTASIDELFRTMDDIKAEARRVRLDLDNLVTKRKVEVKESIVMRGRKAFSEHVEGLKAETDGAWIEMGMPDFAGAVKGKRSFASMKDAVDTMLANAKISADAQAKRIRENLALLEQETVGYTFLFADRKVIAIKAIEDLRLLITNRIERHQADEQRKEDEQRERIRREEEKKAADKVRAEMAAQQKDQPEPADTRTSARPTPTRRQAPAGGSARDAALAAIGQVTQQAAPERAKPRPTDREIIRALAEHFEATYQDVCAWLCDIDLSEFAESGE